VVYLSIAPSFLTICPLVYSAIGHLSLVYSLVYTRLPNGITRVAQPVVVGVGLVVVVHVDAVITRVAHIVAVAVVLLQGVGNAGAIVQHVIDPYTNTMRTRTQ
jgi:uncharacterized membrane protein